jgi:hypothetical protein
MRDSASTAAPSDIGCGGATTRGKVAVVLDPFGNTLVLVDPSKGTYVTDATGAVTGVVRDTEG